MDPTLRSVLDETAVWRRDLTSARAVVDIAARAIVAGVESPSLVLFAGPTHAEADIEIDDLVPGALGVGVPDPANDVLTAAAMARPHPAGEQDARGSTNVVHRSFGHDCHRLVERISSLDDDVDVLEEGHGTSTPDHLAGPDASVVDRVTRAADEIGAGGIAS